jgi:cardiolipin synthase
MIHTKSIVIDGKWSSVGSLNMDNASLLYNFEANIVTSDSKFSEEIVAHFVNDIKDSNEIKLDEWRNRFFLEKIVEVLIILIRKFL